MNARLVTRIIATGIVAVAAATAQNPDSSGDGSLKGDYFVREVLMTGSVSGAVTSASSVIGTATFDGKGNYTFKGQGATLASGANSSLSLSGTYNVAANGFFKMTSLANTADSDFGGVSAVGPLAFVASATEGSNVTLLIGIQAGSNASNSSFKGSYVAGAIDFPGANINSVRQASFNLSADGAGNLGSVSLSGAAADQGGTALNQTAAGVTYTLSGEGSGTVNFGGSGSQLVNGSKILYISADGNIVLGGSAAGFDTFVAIRALSGAGSNSTASGEYYMAALENQLGTSSQATAIDAYYGSVNATGGGTSLFHNRIQSLIFPVSDYTFDSVYTVSATGTVPVGDIPYSYTYGVNGQAFIAMGDAVGSQFYSLTLGLIMQKFSGNGVYLAPNGVVGSATFSPITNPIAPNELITLVGTGLAGGNASATTLPLPTSLGGVQVTINGIAAPLDFVSPTQIVALVPSSISPNNNVFYATVQVTNNNALSNSVTVYTSNTAPGVFASPVATGPAAAQHSANYSLITSASPAAVGETVIIYCDGLGAVTPAVVPDGAAAPSSPLSKVNDTNLAVDFSGVAATFPVPFAGLTPTTAGLYQIDVPIPSGTASNVFVDVATTDGYTSQASMRIGAAAAAVAKAEILQKRLERNQGRARKAAVHLLNR